MPKKSNAAMVSCVNISLSIKRHYDLDVSCIREFNNPKPSTYISGKGLPLNLYFTISELDSPEFTSRVSRDVYVDFAFTVFI